MKKATRNCYYICIAALAVIVLFGLSADGDDGPAKVLPVPAPKIAPGDVDAPRVAPGKAPAELVTKTAAAVAPEERESAVDTGGAPPAVIPNTPVPVPEPAPAPVATPVPAAAPVATPAATSPAVTSPAVTSPAVTPAPGPVPPLAPEPGPVPEVVRREVVADGIAAAEARLRESEVAIVRAMRPEAPAGGGVDAGSKVSWTERYELGPGDTLNFSLYGQPDLAKLNVPVAPDWTVSYLQAKQVSVRGMTVEELRVKMEQVLSDYHRKPKVIVTPALLGSKKYTVLGKVKVNDTYLMDRPTTLLEAIAKAEGLVVGVRGQNAIELADLKRSFVVRDGGKLPVDMEGLYRTGDMTQNVQIEPGDYIYIASNVHNETYVFGSVERPGTVPLTGKLTVMGAIAEAGGYAKYAWKPKVLLVRGSVGNPEAKVIDTREILRGNESDVQLEPGDIVYVNRRPWSYAEEILDLAIRDYIDAATAVAIQGGGSISIGL